MKARLLGIAALATAASAVCFWYFVWGMVFMQEFWNGSEFVAWLMGGLLAAISAVAAGEWLRRTDKEGFPGAGATVLGFARAMLVLQVLAFLYCNAGPMRGLIDWAGRHVVTYGMARDLAPPPSASENE